MPALLGENLEYSRRGGQARAPWVEPVPTSDSTKGYWFLPGTLVVLYMHVSLLLS